MTSMFMKLASAILHGYLATYRAEMNKHSISRTEVVHANSAGTAYIREYSCSKEDVLLDKFGLGQWVHTEEVRLDKDNQLLEVTDTFDWPRCTATRQFQLSEDSEQLQPSFGLWDVRYNSHSSHLRYLVSEKIRSSLQQADRTMFEGFSKRYTRSI